MNINLDLLRSFAEQRYGSIEEITATPLSGGLDSFGVYRIDVTLSSRDAATMEHFVAKHVPASGMREADVYRMLAISPASAFAPRLLGLGEENRDFYLFLEWIQADRNWPWRDNDATAAVLERLALLHAQPVTDFPGVLAAASVESELERSAWSTSDLYDRAFFRRHAPFSMRPMHRAIQRVARDLSSIRRYLIQETGIALLHGDVHSGNAIIRSSYRRPDAVLVDWGRARLGSPLEDVASWLQSLACWEPEVRRAHDSLLVRYLQYAGRPGLLKHGFRRLYWLAAASNAMAGALHYHLQAMLNVAVPPDARERSRAMAADWLRIIRRADEYWRQGDERGHRIAQVQNEHHQTALP